MRKALILHGRNLQTALPFDLDYCTPVVSYPPRLCKNDPCETFLSMYNKGPLCYQCLELVERDNLLFGRHGTHHGYNLGCRCYDCSQSQRDRYRREHGRGHNHVHAHRVNGRFAKVG